jgi:hypothetical protein
LITVRGLVTHRSGFALASRRDKPGFRLRRNDGEVASGLAVIPDCARDIPAILAIVAPALPCARDIPAILAIVAPALPCARDIPAILAIKKRPLGPRMQWW